MYLFEKKNATIIKKEFLLFDSSNITSLKDDSLLYLYLLKVGSKFVVHAPTFYQSDNYIRKDGLAKISLPAGLSLEKEFLSLAEASQFFEDVRMYIGTPFKILEDANCNYYSLDLRYDVNIRFNKFSPSDDIFKKSFIRHGYQLVSIRMHRIGSEIVINKAIKIQFKEELVAIQYFEQIKNYFLNLELKTYEYHGKENFLENNVQQIILNNSEQISEFLQERDSLGRLLSFTIKLVDSKTKYHLDIKYSLPTYNERSHGGQIRASIFVYINGERKFSERYSNKEFFLEELIVRYKEFKKVISI